MFITAAKRAIASGAKSSKIMTNIIKPSMFRPMVTLVEKELGEETKYIRKMEREAMKAKLEKILDQDDNSAEKQELGKLLGIFFKINFLKKLFTLQF